METENKSLFRITTRQALLLGVLSLCLCGVIAMSFDSGEPGPGDSADQPELARRPRPKAATQEDARSTNWPKISLDEMLSHNPFESLVQKSPPVAEVAIDQPVETPKVEPDPDPGAAPADREAQKETALAAFRDLKVRMILRTGKISSAMLGNRVVHENDVVDGVRILSIRPDGLRVKWVGE